MLHALNQTFFLCVCVSARVHVLYPKDIVCVLSFKKHQAHDHSYQSCLRDYCKAPLASAVGILHGSVSTTAVCVEAVRRSITGYRQ